MAERNKTVILFASPRGERSVTKQKLDEYLKQDPGDGITLYDAYKETPAPCIGCGRCDETGRCFMRDTDDIIREIRDCDRLIVATPVYNYSFPAPLKAFVDRMQPFFSHPMERERECRGVLIAVCGASGKYSFDIITKQTETLFRELGVTFAEKHFTAHTDNQ